MKKSVLLSIIFIWLWVGMALNVNAQGVGINASGNPADTSAILDVSATNKGMLLPRLTSTQRDSISNPAEGLLIYNSDTKCYNYFNGTNWAEWCGTCTPQPSVANAGADQINLPGTTTTLAANTPVHGAGAWTIQSGTGGTVTTLASATSNFTGTSGITYVLRWTVSNTCGSTYDEVTIQFVIPDVWTQIANFGGTSRAIAVGFSI